jgi:hypothetical protein
VNPIGEDLGESKANEEIHEVKLRFGRGMKRLTIFYLLAFVFFDIFMPLTVVIGIGYNYTPSVAVGFFLMTLLALALLVYVYFSWYRADDFGIEYHGVFRRSFSLRWDEIDSIIPDQTSRWSMVYVGGGGHKMTLRSVLTGLPEFAVLVVRHLPEEKWKPATQMIMAGYSAALGAKRPVHPSDTDVYSDEMAEVSTDSETRFK